MGDNKHPLCGKGLHRLEGYNAIQRADGTRCCRACQNARGAKHKRDQRAPRLRWQRFTLAELAAIHRALVKAPVGDLPRDIYETTQRLLKEVIQQFDERNGFSRSEAQPVRSSPNHQDVK